MDIAANAVAHARAHYLSKNLEFRIGSCSAIPLPDHSVDIVVSFETIEHHYEHDAMMREVKRVLVPEGVLVISSPDRLEYSDKPNYDNPYHVRELYRAEFDSLLKRYFRNHHMSGQRIVYGSAIFNEDSAGRVCSFGINDKVMLPAPGITRALYLVAIASDAELPMAESGLLEQPIAESDDVRERHKQIVALSQSLGERDGRIAALDQAIAERDGRVAALDQAIAERDGRIVGLEAGVMERHEQILYLNRLVAQRDQTIDERDLAAAAASARINGLTEAVADRDGQVAALARVAAERDGQIDILTHAVAEREEQVARLTGTVADRDERIAGLDRAAFARDQQIADLALAATARNAEIAQLGESLGEREERIAGLEQVATLREEHVIGLESSIGARDGQVTDLLLAVADRDRQIAEVHHAVTERDARVHGQQHQIEMLLQSRSWRWTRPMRLMTGPARSGLRSLRGALNRSSARLPLLRQIPIRRVRQNPLFDSAFYVLANPDVRSAGIDPATHYVQSGWRELRDASERFSTRAYLEAYPDVAAEKINPLLHYIDYGQAEGRQISPATRGSGQAPETAYSTVGLSDAIDQTESGDIDASRMSDVGDDRHQDSETNLASGVASEPATSNAPAPGAAERQEPIQDDVDHAAPIENVPAPTSPFDRLQAEIDDIDRSGMFDAVYYQAMYPDLQQQLIDPIRHYCEYGWREGRNPSDDFNTRGYLDTYSDIRNADLNPFWHYVVAGALECRLATPDSNNRFEDDIYFGNSISDVRLIAYYTTPDWKQVQRAHQGSASQRLLPHADLGFYTTLNSPALDKQARIAKRHGVCGWCFPMDAAAKGDPLSELLTDRGIDIGFCLEIDLLGTASVQASIARLSTALLDDRYLKIDGRPLLIMTLPNDDSEYSAVLEQFNQLSETLPLPHPHRMGRFNSPMHRRYAIAARYGCEALLDFPIDPVPGETGTFRPFHKNGVDTVPYSVIVSQAIGRLDATTAAPVPVYRSVTLGRDDSSINPDHPLRYSRFHLKEYRRWLDAVIADARTVHHPDRRFLFINAWNDWNRGAVLEPDRLSGYGKLNETSRALLGKTSGLALPKVSVIVPNYNHAPYLHRRLESIYRQTYTNIEVLLLDDCSTDDSRAVLLEYANRYPECTRTLFNEMNSGGVFRQWAKGIKAASGALIWVAESDDYCDENFLEKLVRSFDDEAVMLAYSKIEFVHADETVIPHEFAYHVRDLACREKWLRSHVNTAHQEVGEALGIINTIPNASGAVFRRPVDMELLENEDWLSMSVVGDWVFYLHILRGGKIAYSAETTNFFRRYDGSTAASTYHKAQFYRELGIAALTVQRLYDVPASIVEKSRERSKQLYDHFCASSDEEFAAWFDEGAILEARKHRTPNLMISTMSFHPGGAEILPIRIANELKRLGHSVLLLCVGVNEREDGVRRMLRNDVPVVETPDIEKTKYVIRDFGIEVLNSHQWHVQKYPALVPDVYDDLKAHVASLHGMIEHGDAFGVTSEQIKVAHENVSTWVYTADKNLGPFIEHGLYKEDSTRFAKLPNGMAPPEIVPIPRSEIGIPDDAFVLCCVSRAIPDKGWAESIEAVTGARERSGRDIRLILVGNGPVHDEYRRTGVPDFVYLAGFSENSVGFYATSDMGIMLTKFRSESFPLTIVDCLFAGKPYVACDVGEIRTMLTDGKKVAGAVVSLSEWQVPVAQVAEIIAAYSADVHKYADALAVVPALKNRYRLDNVVEKYLEIFRNTLDSRAVHSESRILETIH